MSKIQLKKKFLDLYDMEFIEKEYLEYSEEYDDITEEMMSIVNGTNGDVISDEDCNLLMKIFESVYTLKLGYSIEEIGNIIVFRDKTLPDLPTIGTFTIGP